MIQGQFVGVQVPNTLSHSLQYIPPSLVTNKVPGTTITLFLAFSLFSFMNQLLFGVFWTTILPHSTMNVSV